MMAGQERDGERWARLEAQLDELLTLDEAARQARLAVLECQHPEDAAALRQWLHGMQASAGRWLLPEGQAPSAVQHQAGEVIGNWRLLEPIGRGGMGEVWLAARDDGLFAKQVAIKFIRENRQHFHQGIESERRLLAGLRHAAIVRLLDAGITESGEPFLVTDYIEGQTLDIWLAEQQPDLQSRLAIFRQVAEAVAHAHENLVIHCDIKPANVRVDAQGQAYLLDFGIARLAGQSEQAPNAGIAALTPGFAAPEVLTGEPIGARNDIYALGALLYYLLCGKAPLDFKGLTRSEVLARIGSQRPEPLLPNVPETLRRQARKDDWLDWQAIIEKAMHKQADARYGTVEAMLRDIQAVGAQYPVSARPQGIAGRTRRSLRRHRLAMTTIGIVLLALLAGLLGTLWQARQAALQRDIARAEAKTAAAVRDFMIEVFKDNSPEHHQGQAPDALALLDAGAERIRGNLQGQPQLQAELWAALGETYAGLGRYDKAQALLEEAFAKTDTLMLPAPSRERLLRAYALVIQQRGGPWESLRRRLEKILAEPLPDTPAEQAVRHELRAYYGGLLARTGELDTAARQLQQAEQAAKALGDAGKRAYREALQQQAQLAEARGQREASIAKLRELLAELEAPELRMSGERRRAQENLAVLLGIDGRGDEALGMLQALQQENLAVYGAAHPVTLSGNINLARALQRQRQQSQAKALMEEVLRLASEHHGEASEIALLAQTNLAALEYGQGQFGAALTRLEWVYQHVRQLDGADSPRALLMLQNLARVRLDSGDYRGTQRDLETLLARLEAIGSDATAEPMALLGDIARQLGNPARARGLHQQALNLYAQAGDSESFSVQELRLSLAEDARDLDEFEVARAHAAAGLAGLQQLGEQSNAGMIEFARYLLAQLEVLEEGCTVESLAAIEAIAAAQHASYPDGVPPERAWRLSRIALYQGLCMEQLPNRKAEGREVARRAAAQLLQDPLADPHSKKLARSRLQESR